MGALAEQVAFLETAEAYGARAPVESIETHRSWVFLTEDRAYKLKKPAKTDQLDLSTAEARRGNCETEVQLNRRLAPDVYLGVVPLVRRDGSLALGGPGEVTDWLVEMRRLPRDRMMDHRIRHGLVGDDDVTRLAQRLARFYAQAERAGWSGPRYRAHLERSVRRYRREIDAPRFRQVDGALDVVTAAQLDLLRARAALFDARAPRVADLHGDLRPEHVVLGPEPIVIDCLEFDRELRLLDPVSELSFLALECERMGAPETGARVLEAYADVARDRPSAALVDFYGSQHAIVRAAVALWHLDDPDVADGQRWIDVARAYVRLAEGRARRIRAGALQASR